MHLRYHSFHSGCPGYSTAPEKIAVLSQLKHFVLSCALIGLSWQGLAQSALPPLVASGSLIEAGTQLHDQEKYDEALAKYQQVSRNDTNYTWVLSEMALTYTVLKQYEKAIAAAQEGLQHPSEYTLDLHLRLGNAYDEHGQPEKALEVFDKALIQFPHSHQLYFERGVVLARLERTADAIQSFQRAIDASYFHASSHYALGKLCGENGYPVQSMLSLMTYVIMQPESERAVSALVSLEEWMTDEKKLASTSKAVGITDAFPELTRLVRSRLALQEKYEFKSKMRYKLVKQVQAVLEQLPANRSSNDFWVRNYANSYQKLWNAGLFEPFTFFAMAAIDKEAAQKYQKDNKDIRRFRDWASEEFARVNAYKKDVLNGKEGVCFHSYYQGGRLSYLAQQYDEKKKTVSGDFEGYYSTGALRSKGMYTADGRKTGVWHYYHPSGEISQIQRYTSPDSDLSYQSFYPNGQLKEEGKYVAGKLNGLLTVYSSAGAKIFEGNYLNDQKQGRAQSFYPDQTPKAEAVYEKGVQNGPYRNYHPNGALSDEGTIRNGKEHGPYVSYSNRGKCLSQGNMNEGQADGEWKWFHPNGQVEKTGSYRGGKQQGTWKMFFPDGKLSQEFNQVNGQMEGVGKVYDTDGKLHFEHDYKAGKVQKYRYYNKQGQVLHEEAIRSNKLRWQTYYASGAVHVDGEMLNDEPEGKWKRYHEIGYLASEEFYRNGQQEGTEKLYYPSGSLSVEQTYQKGELNGLHRAFYENGQLASQGWYVKGQRQGEWLFYHINGQPKEKRYYLNNELDGHQEYYQADGKPYLELVYRDGLVEEQIQYDTLNKAYHRIPIRQGNGVAERKYPNGQLQQRSTYHFGEKEGEEVVYYPNGKLQQKHYFRHQTLHGPSQTYYFNGKLRSELTFRLGEADSTYQAYNEKGQLEFISHYTRGQQEGINRWLYPSGKTETEGPMKAGEREGYFTYYTEDGIPRYRLFYLHGLIQSYSYQNAAGQWNADIALPKGTGKIKAYYPNGQLSLEVEVKNGQKQGLQRTYHPNGQLRSEVPLVNGMIHGEKKEYHANGKLSNKEQQFYDYNHGLCQEFREDGSLAKETHYLLGDKHGWEREFDAARKVTAKRKYVYDEPYE